MSKETGPASSEDLVPQYLSQQQTIPNASAIVFAVFFEWKFNLIPAKLQNRSKVL
jgi:hypothetical protein